MKIVYPVNKLSDLKFSDLNCGQTFSFVDDLENGEKDQIYMKIKDVGPYSGTIFVRLSDGASFKCMNIKCTVVLVDGSFTVNR